MTHFEPSSPQSEPLISIIIPVFNAEYFVETCINSVLEQSFQQFEIVCIDDCSQDKSASIIYHLRKKDGRIRLLSHLRNMGEGAARNLGLDLARGDYIFHLDADDNLPHDALERLYREVEINNSDLVKGGLAYEFSNGKLVPEPLTIPEKRIVNTNIYECQALEEIPTSHCCYLYKRALLKEFSIRYPTQLSVGLDIVALTKTLVRAKTVTLIPNVVYHYHQSAESATRGAIRQSDPFDIIETRSLVSSILFERDLDYGAKLKLQKWDDPIVNIWGKMAKQFPPEFGVALFQKFRALINSHGLVPWQDDTPSGLRYVLALVMTHHDEEALTLLASDEFARNISGYEKLKSALEFVLEYAPDDVGALFELAQLEIDNGDADSCIAYCNQLLIERPGYTRAIFLKARALTTIGQFEFADRILYSVSEAMLKDNNTSPHPAGLRVIENSIHMAAVKGCEKVILELQTEILERKLEFGRLLKEKNAVDGKLVQVHTLASTERRRYEVAVESYRSSLSWRITSPLRAAYSLIRRILRLKI